MNIHDRIYKLRTSAKMSQEEFAELFNVSRQSVQKWESGESTPDLTKLVKISKHFGISLDALILGHDNRLVEELPNTKLIKPQYDCLHDWDFYAADLMIEFQQCIEE